MAETEISPSSSDPQNPKPNPPTRDAPPGTKRLLLTLTVLASFLLSLPILLRSTAIHRSPLPFPSVRALPRHPHLPPCRLHAVFLHPSLPSSPSRLASLLSDHIRLISGASPCGSCDGEVLVTLDRGGRCERSWDVGDGSGLWRCGAVEAADFVGEAPKVDDLLHRVVGSGGEVGGKVYTVVVVGGREGTGEMKGVIGRYRHGWVVGVASEEEAVTRVARIFTEVFVRGGRGSGEGGDEGMEEFMPVGLDGSVTWSFSLLNADPSDWVYDWDFQMGEDLLAPVVEALAPLANIRIESQVLYHTPKSSFSHWDKKLQSYIFSTGDLPFFVNSNEWHLDTSIAADGRSKVLQFVVYIPSAKECPLLLQLPNKDISMTNAFVTPMWGGVIVWNPPTCSVNTYNGHLSKEIISPQEFHKLFQIFISQLRSLFGLQFDNLRPAELGLSNILGSEKGFTEWELDFLQRRHACNNLQSCATTLESLCNLVQSLPRMIVMDEIGKQVALSLEAAALAHNDASLGIYNNSAAFARKARALAEDAFFHPSISSISYSSLEHYFAIYMPFFAPVSLHVLLAAARELRRYKHERAKYLASIARSTQA